MAKVKIKLNLNNAKSISRFLFMSIIVFRIISVVFLVAAPICLALAVNYDKGLKSLILYLYELGFNSMQNISANIEDFLENLRTDIWSPLPALVWLISGFAIFFFFFLPFIIRKSQKGRMSNGVWFILASIIFISSIYIIWLTLDYYPHKDFDINSKDVDYYSIRWLALKEWFNPFSFWMIIIQGLHLLLMVFGILCIIESKKIKSKKLKYSSVFVDTSAQSNSLEQKILNEEIMFGEFDKSDIKKLTTKKVDDKNREEDNEIPK